MNLLPRLLPLAAALLALGACTTVPKVKTEYSPSMDFSAVKTFAVLPMPTQVSGTDPGTMMRVADPAKAAIIADQEAKGYRVSPIADADILVGLHGELLPRTQVVDTGLSYNRFSEWGDTYPYGAAPVVRQYDQGTLAIEVFRNTPAQDDLVWVGWTTKKRAPGAPVSVEGVITGINEILMDFPPEPGSGNN